MLGDVVQPQRFGVADQLAEDTVAARKRADDLPGRIVHPASQEALELTFALVQNAERGVLRPGQVASGLEKVAQDRLEVELGHERSSHGQQALKLVFAEATAIRDQLIGFVSGHSASDLNRAGAQVRETTEIRCGPTAMKSDDPVAIIARW